MNQVNYFNFFSKLYDLIQDPVCLFDSSGHVIYCNESFSNMIGVSQIRLLNKKSLIYSAFVSLNETPLNKERVLQFCELSGSSILKFETKKILRGLGQFLFQKIKASDLFIELASTKLDSNQETSLIEIPNSNDIELFQLSIKDLTIEEELVKSFRFEIASQNKKIQEMNQLVDIFQKIRLLDDPSLIINEFMAYILSSTKVTAAANRINQNLQVIFGEISDNQSEFKDLKFEIQKYLNDNRINKYYTHKSNVKSDASNYYHWAVVPFRLAADQLQAIFIFDSYKQLDEFSHQSAIILSEQLNLILNNLTLKELSFTDGLTKLKNNLYFRKKIEDECSQGREVQLILFDVDFFKKINDTYGHPGGDAVLIYLGETIQNTVQKFAPAYDLATIARVGGEEFAILLPDRDPEFAFKLAESLRLEIENDLVEFNTHKIKFTISLGLSHWSKTQSYSPDAVKLLYKAADDALYNSKRTGRNKTSFLAAA